MKILKKYFPHFLILALSIFAIIPLLNPGFFPIHDDTQVARVFEMSKALKDGMFPVRWVMDLGFGYGYPIFNFYAPLAYYIGGFINLLGVNVLDSTKIMMLIGIIMSAFFMYLFSKEIFGKAGGVLSALFYMYAPYHAVDIYVRGDVGEFYAYAFIPLLFYGLYKIYKKESLKYVFITSVAFALLILSHNLTALMVTPFAVLFALLLIYKNNKIFYKLLASLILGLSLSAFYFIPTLLEMGYTNVISQVGGGADFKDHFVCIWQLWTSPWGFGGSARGCVDGVSFMIGKYHIAFSLMVVGLVSFSFFSKKLFKLTKEELDNFNIIFLFFIFSLISIFLMLDASSFIWKIIKPMEFLQYPWRFLIIAIFSLSFIAGGFLWVVSKFVKGNGFYISFIILSVGVVIVNMKFFVPQRHVYKTSNDYVRQDEIRWSVSKISSEYMPKGFMKPNSFSEIANYTEVSNASVEILSSEYKTQNVNIKLRSNTYTAVVIPIAYFPAWSAAVDNKRVSIAKDIRGSRIQIPQGEHLISFKFIQTPIEKTSNAISIAGLLSLFIGIIYFRKKHEKI